MSKRILRKTGLLSVVVLALSWSAPAEARPGMHTIRVEGAGALHVGDQFERFDFGGGFGLGYELRPIPYVGVEARYHAYFWPVARPRPGALTYGDYHGLGLAARVHPAPDLDVGDLWMDAGLNLVLTGEAARPGIEVGVGFEIEVAWFLRLGPFVRFAHVFQPDDDQLGPPDASFLEFGVSFAFLGEEPVGDRDGDGILDPDDQCPDEPEDVDGVDDEDGCPDADPEPQDRDGDGIVDPDDQCPDEPEDRDGFQDEDGCPDLDHDEDGILDPDDQCPEEREVFNGYEDQDGCPDEAPAEAELRRLTERILFPHDRARPTRESMPVLARVAGLIQAHTEWVLIRIEGHASDAGEADYNLRLSERRAERIRAELVRLGVAEDRLEVRAFGETQPEVQGVDEEARALNRRVTFTVLERR